MITFQIYVVDDDSFVREAVVQFLEGEYQVKSFPSAEEALEEMPSIPPDLILLDIGLPGISGLEALERIKRMHPDILTIMITAFDDIDTVIAAMKLGARDYVVKPIRLDALENTIRNCLETIRLRKEVQALQEKYIQENLPCFIGESRAIKDVIEFVNLIAKSPDTPVLILGETGTGKELIASAIHYRSPNFKGPFVPVNCASLPQDLVESELFGYEKGAFSGANSTGKKGLIEEAAQGTLFLDEVGDLRPEAQAKLLRFLEEGEYYRIGGTKSRKVQTRIVSATNKDIEEMVERNLFRKDLYYRLGVVRIEMPSLDQRSEDILPMANYFLVEFRRKMGKNLIGISPQAQEALRNSHWQGNVRELKNLIERGVLVSKGPELTVQDLGMNGKGCRGQGADGKKGFSSPAISPSGLDFPSLLKSFEQYYLQEALALAKGNAMKAAELLRLNHHTFRYRRRNL